MTYKLTKQEGEHYDRSVRVSDCTIGRVERVMVGEIASRQDYWRARPIKDVMARHIELGRPKRTKYKTRQAAAEALVKEHGPTVIIKKIATGKLDLDFGNKWLRSIGDLD